MINKQNIKNIYNLTPLQEGMLFHSLHDPTSGAYFEQTRLHIVGPLDCSRFRQAWQEVVARHDILRTLFAYKDVPEPLQIVLKQRPPQWQYIDLQHLDAAAQDTACNDYALADRRRGFSLDQDVLIRLAVFQRGPASFEVIWSFHHILLDGWSSSVLQQEVLQIYQALDQGRAAQLPPPIPFSRYIKWLKQQDHETGLAYWQDYLSGYRQLASWSGKQSRAEQYRPGQWQTHFSAEQTQALQTLAQTSQVTLNTLMQALWGISLCQATGQTDVVFGATVAGRPAAIEQVEQIVGLFINAVPVRVNASQAGHFPDLLQHLQQAANAGQDFHYLPLPDIQALTPLKNRLFDHILVFENYPLSEAVHTEADSPLRVDRVEHDDHSSYDLTVQMIPGESLELLYLYNQCIYSQADIAAIHARLAANCRQISHEHELDLTQFLPAVAAADTSAAAAAPLSVALAATFTVEPVLPYLRWWFQAFGLAIEPHTAPYNQIFQQLLDERSLIATNPGPCLLLMRLEDWLRERRTEDTEAAKAHLSRSSTELLQLLTQAPPSQPCWIGILPVARPQPHLPPAIVRHIETLQRHLRERLSDQPNIHLLELERLEQRYAIHERHDTHQDYIGHIPFTEPYLAALGTHLARQLIAGRTPPFKLIAVDCDNTLWAGICGEDGPTEVHIGPGHRHLQQQLIAKQAQGFLLALCSKNNAADVWAVFDQHPEMLLARDHLVAWRINWAPKSQNLRELAATLDIGSNSLLFLDDSAVEISEVMSHAPEVLAVQIPPEPAAFPDFLEHLWALDKLTVTVEDRQRTALYQAAQQRAASEQQAPSLAEFLAGLALDISVTPMATADLARAAQLTQRTNQFNLSTKRRSEAELEQLQASPGVGVWTVRVSDRFGDYGLVGLIITEVTANGLNLDTLLLSCRVLGRQVEDCLLHGLGQYAHQQQLSLLLAEYRATAKNAPALDFLQRSGWQAANATAAGGLYRFPVSPLPELPTSVQFTWREEAAPTAASAEQPAEQPGNAPRQAPSRQPITPPSVTSADVAATRQTDWPITLVNEAALLHRAYYWPLQYHRAADLVTLALPEPGVTVKQRPYRPPVTATEQRLAAIWQELLGVEQVGLYDDFHDLGGHSLKATRLIARIQRAFGVELGLAEIFTAPTLTELAKIIDTHGADSAAEHRPTAIGTLAAQSHYALSHAQRRLWVLQALEPASVAYNTPAYLALSGPFESAAFNRALADLWRRHEALRTYFITHQGEPRQCILPADSPAPTGELIDLSHLVWPAAESEARHQAEQDARTPFELAAGPLIRVRLFRLAAEEHRLLLNLHHICCDGWSIGLLERELLTLYAGYCRGQPVELPQLPLQYKDFAAWQNARLAGEVGNEQRQYWLTKLGGELTPLALPTDFPRPSIRGLNGRGHPCHFPAEHIAVFEQFCSTQKATLFMGLLACLKVLLHHYTGQTDLIVGTPVAGREHPDLHDQVGLYINTLALRNSVDPGQGFAVLLAQVRETTLQGHAHQTYPFDALVDELQPQRDTSRSPLFDVMLALQEADTPALDPVPELRVSAEELDVGSARFDLSFNLARTADGLVGSIAYDTDLFSAARIERLADHLGMLLTRIPQARQRPIGRLDLLPPAEYRQVTQTFQGLALAPPAPDNLVARFAEQAARTPDAIAVHDPAAGEWTYAELDAQSGRLAQHLTAQYPIQADSRIALCAERGAALLVGLLGILKSGAAYVPIDPSAPAARREHIVTASGSLTVLEPAHIANLAAQTPAVASPPQAIQGNQLAYVIYTSGSTGSPKGVMVEHRSFINMIDAQIEAFDITGSERVLLFASPAFDASLSEIFMGLLSGACLVPVSQATIEDTAAFRAFLANQGVTVATLPPVYLGALGQQPLPSLRTLITAGDTVDPGDALAHAAYVNFFNAYGPTEVSVCTSLQRVRPDPCAYPLGIPIGGPLPNLRVVILNPAGQPVPIGIPGEIGVAGMGLARGYLDQPELTRQAFTEAPEMPGGRLYRTGDLGRWREDGAIDYLGRRDDQVKIRGHRVEPEEIASQLRQHPAVAEAAVVAYEHANSQTLAAFFVALPATGVSNEALQHYLSEHLPAFMLPAVVMELNELPRTMNAKLDRQRLAEWARQRTAATEAANGNAPRSATEQLVAEAWQAVLGRPAPSVQADFFALGGDSIQAIQIISRLREQGVNAEVKDLLTQRTIAGLASRVSSLPPTQVPAPTAPLAEAAPLTPIQEWFFWEYPRAHQHFNQAGWFYAAAGIDQDALAAALRAVWNHHDALRMAFRRFTEGGEIQQISRTSDATQALKLLHISDLCDLMPEQAAPVRQQRVCAAQANLDLAHDPLLNAYLFRQSNGDYLFLFVHHLVMDGVSWRILLTDLEQAYEQSLAGQAIELPAKTTAFVHWAKALRDYSQTAVLRAEQPHWHTLLADRPIAGWPAEPAGVPDNTQRQLDIAEFQLDYTGTSRLLTDKAPQHQVTLEAILLAALANTLYQWHGQFKTLIMLEGHGREPIHQPVDINRTIGWFTAHFPFVLETSPAADLTSNSQQVQQRLNRLPSRIGWAVLKHLTPAEWRDPELFAQKPAVNFNYLGQFNRSGRQHPARFQALPAEPPCATHATAEILYCFDINAIVLDGCLSISLTYNRLRYSQATIETIMMRYRTALQQLAHGH